MVKTVYVATRYYYVDDRLEMDEQIGIFTTLAEFRKGALEYIKTYVNDDLMTNVRYACEPMTVNDTYFQYQRTSGKPKKFYMLLGKRLKTFATFVDLLEWMEKNRDK
jgi:hypothetical protein